MEAPSLLSSSSSQGGIIKHGQYRASSKRSGEGGKSRANTRATSTVASNTSNNERQKSAIVMAVGSDNKADNSSFSDHDRHRQRNVFFGIPILGFFRHRQVDTKSSSNNKSATLARVPSNRRRHDNIVSHPDEARPLIDQATTKTSSVRFEHAEAADPYSCSLQRPKRTAKENWAILREHVRNETFHIQDWRTRTERLNNAGNSQCEKHFSEMSLPYEFSVWACVLAWIIYLAISVLAYSVVFEQWTVIESMYFANVSFTTIGYGDLAPTTRGGRIFCCFFALAGVCVLGIALGIVGSKIIESEVETLELAEQKVTRDAFSLFSRDTRNPRELRHSDSSTGTSNSGHSTYSYLTDYSLASTFRQDMEDRNKWKQTLTWWRSLCGLLCRYTPALAPLFLGAYLIARYEGWEVEQTLYYMVVTSTTIGYGDYVPEREGTKLLAVFYIPLAVGAMGHFLGTIANFIIDQRRQKFDKKLWRHELTLEDLRDMDEDDDGIVTELEFMIFMLVAMKKVDKDLTDRIREHFRKLDLSNSGTLVREDLELMAKKKLRSVRTKLRLREYKAKLESFCEDSEHGSFENEV